MTATDETFCGEKIEKLKRDQDLLTFVSNSLKRSDQLTKGMRGRLESAKSQLESEFQVLLGRYSKPVQTVKILDVLAKKSLNGSTDGVEEVQLIPQTRLQDIISISTWLIGEDAALTAKRRVSASKFKTRSLERNPSHHSLGKLEPSSFFT
ncbi:uncharacterized protein isoform X1 [Salmo salar]|uniref:Uncharacterized protein isoform X1 n=1 Tax=Salmo salar TaxID=8030 RepID=A0A1S3RDQ2_SALSA|nr:uncharacterized protein LOC106602066 isoform X1 [Salmo salar]